ncbi:hypothetical protein MMC21_005812 [Puttea exsequens]|nr:hypothetical protein [Puttea exsequens]
MGVPGLTTALRPYSSSTAVGCKTENCHQHRTQIGEKPNTIIIDGPCFAHHIYNILTSQRRASLDNLPSYKELGDEAIAYLDELQSYGLPIEKIYFDGFLPPKKRKIRVNRLRNDLRTLTNYCCNPASRSLPKPPLIVPAVLDALSGTKYGSVTIGVPGEAETYCAAAARRSHGTPLVFSYDSDVYLHDLGLDGSVVSFSTLKRRPLTVARPITNSTIPCQILYLDIFKSEVASKRLGVNLHDLAFQYLKGRSQSLSQAIAATKQPRAHEKTELQVFREDYLTEPAVLEAQYFVSVTVQMLTTPRDPRISEFICQICSKTLGQSPIEVYLPSLIEDPSRASAWLPSLDLRLFAYSMPQPLNVLIKESRGRGGETILRPFSFMSAAATQASTHSLNKQIKRCIRTFSNLSLALQLRISAIVVIHRWHYKNDKMPPLTELIIKVCTGISDLPLSWEEVHLEAQVQGWLYSLRMVQQVASWLQYTSRQPYSRGSFADLMEPVELPPLAELVPSRAELAKQMSKIDNGELEKKLSSLLKGTEKGCGDEVPATSTVVIAKESKKTLNKKTTKKDLTALVAAKEAQASDGKEYANRFAVLSSDYSNISVMK